MLIAGLLVQRRGASKRRHGARQQNALQGSYARIRDLAVAAARAQDTERSRIARELHDDISQQIAVLEIDLELLGARLAPQRKRSRATPSTARKTSPKACTIFRTACIRQSCG